MAQDGRPQSRQMLLAALRGAIVAAEQSIFDAISAEPSHKGMATTCDLVFLAAGSAFIAHVGDSRVYLLRGDTGRQLTVDHTVANFLRSQGKSEAEIRLHPHSDKLIRALGMSGGAESDTLQLDLRTNDRLVICSDGLYRYLHSPMHLRQLYGDRTTQEASEYLCQWAVKQGGEDNVTAVCMEISDPGARPDYVETDSRVSALGKLTFFQNLNYQEMLQIMPITYERRALPGDRIIIEGEEGEELFLLLDGACEVQTNGIQVAKVEVGQVFGELALVDRRPRSATVTATNTCRLLVLRRTDFEEITRTGPLANKLLWNVINDLASRLRNATTRIAEQGKIIRHNSQQISSVRP
jgi:serine/threonine protein phosphatase PrpC